MEGEIKPEGQRCANFGKLLPQHWSCVFQTTSYYENRSFFEEGELAIDNLFNRALIILPGDRHILQLYPGEPRGMEYGYTKGSKVCEINTAKLDSNPSTVFDSFHKRHPYFVKEETINGVDACMFTESVGDLIFHMWEDFNFNPVRYESISFDPYLDTETLNFRTEITHYSKDPIDEKMFQIPRHCLTGINGIQDREG